MNADKNKIYKKNCDLENRLEDTRPLLSFQSNEDNDDGDDGKNKNIEKVLTVTEIVDTIIKASQDIPLRRDHINRDELLKVVSKLHHHQPHAFSSNEFIVFKKYEDLLTKIKINSKDECKYDYGIFKHREMDLIFRIDSADDQIDNENKIAQIILNKYNNSYKNVLQMGIVLPFYAHIQHSSMSPLFPLYYSIQPYMSGITLDCWVEKNKYKRNFIEIVYDLFIQLCAIIKELHELECVHGDLKPGNILVVSNANTSQNCVYLIDFGLAGIHLKTRHASGGTLPYCAPETQNTCALNFHNKRCENNAVFNVTNYKYNWTLHNKSHDIWSMGLIFISIYIFKETYHYYKNYPYDFFTNSGYVSQNYFQNVEHEYIRDVLSKHVLVEPARRCNIQQLSELLSNLVFM